MLRSSCPAGFISDQSNTPHPSPHTCRQTPDGGGGTTLDAWQSHTYNIRRLRWLMGEFRVKLKGRGGGV
ncbi:hypothetical protein Hanom_Chr09g00808981 [Helianthus anomalus]